MTGQAESAEVEAIPTSGKVFGKKQLCAFAAIFVVAFSACLIHHFAETNTRTIYFADSRNYLTSADHFCTMMLDAVHGKPPNKLMSDESVRFRIETDGPIMATIYGTLFALIGRPPVAEDWKVFVIVQSLIHSVSSVLIALLTYRIVPCLRYAVPAGLAYALFPPAIISTGRLMTETLSNFLTLSFLLSLNMSFKNIRWGALTGFLTGLSFVNRVLLAPAVVSTLALSLLAKKLKPLTLVLIMVCFCVILTPWLMFSSKYLGRPMITTERGSYLNAYTGMDTERQGYRQSVPTNRESIMLNQPPLTIMFGQILNNPGGCTMLVLKKASRLYGQAFNDFRHHCLGLDYHAIRYLQWLYVFMGIAGVFFLVAGGFRKLQPEARMMAFLSLTYLSMAQIFFLFEANSRYGFTAFPLLTVFGAVAAYLFVARIKERKLPLALSVIATSLAVAFFATQSERIFDGFKTEKLCTLKSGQTAECRILFKEGNSPFGEQEFALLLVDGEKGLDNAKVTINGKPLNSPILPLNLFDSLRYRNYNYMRECAYGLGVNVDDLRQWRAAVVPIQMLNRAGENTFAITAGNGGAAIYEDPEPASGRYRDTLAISVNALLNSADGYESRPFNVVRSGRAEKKFSLVTAGKVQSSESLRMYLGFASKVNRKPVVYRTATDSVSNTSAALQNQSIEKAMVRRFVPDDFPLLTRVHNTDEVQVNKFVVAHSVTGTDLKIPKYKSATHVRVTIRGQVRAQKDDSSASIAMTSAADDGLPWMLPRLPFSIPANKQWKDFELTDVVPLDIYEGRVSQLAIGLYPGLWPEVSGVGPSAARGHIYFRKLSVTVEPESSLDLKMANLMLY